MTAHAVDAPVRDSATWSACRCVLILGTHLNECETLVPPDVPFCRACEERHPRMTAHGNITVARRWVTT